MYIGWRTEKDRLRSLQLAGGRYPFQIANGLLLSDGYADGGSRGALWTNPQVAWAPAAQPSLSYAVIRGPGEPCGLTSQ